MRTPDLLRHLQTLPLDKQPKAIQSNVKWIENLDGKEMGVKDYSQQCLRIIDFRSTSY